MKHDFYTDEDLNPHNHRRWLHVLIHLSATFPLKILFLMVMTDKDLIFNGVIIKNKIYIHILFFIFFI